MDLMIKIYLERAQNEILASEVLMKISKDEELKKLFEFDQKTTFYSSVISHAYYSIFYSAKAILLKEGIKPSSPNVHKKTYDFFKKYLVDTKKLDKSLFDIYNDLVIKADELLDIFFEEKKKRGDFTYKTIHQANIYPAEKSIENVKLFFANINEVILNESV